MEYRPAAETSPALVIAAASQDTGDLAIHDDDDELTVEVGKLHHSHFSEYSHDGSIRKDRLAQACSDAAKFVSEILSDQVCITVRYKGEECVGSSAKHLQSDTSLGMTLTYPLAASRFRATRTERFLWSGRLP